MASITFYISETYDVSGIFKSCIMEYESKKSFNCPSYLAKPGASIFGIVNSNGFVDYLHEAVVIDETFLLNARKNGIPEKRFRFSDKCAKSGCKQWDTQGHECGLINKIINVIGNPEEQELQYCPIRSKCRWYAQKQGLACAQCNEIIRNLETTILETEM